MLKPWRMISIAVLLWLSSTITVFAEGQLKSDMRLELNGQPMQVGDSYLIDNSLFVPYRALAEGIGAEVGYEASTQTVTVKKGAKLVKLSIGSSEALIDGTPQTMVGPAQLINGTTFVHSRFLAETFGLKVNYDDVTRKVNIVSDTAASTYFVTIEGFQFKGGNISVETGSTIIFTNRDKVKHNAAAVNGSFRTPYLATGESASVTLNEPGDYAYICELHQAAMQGIITVK
ncbi:stalk domain-containing protein [Paenibacillus sp. MAH-36]|uniref:Stalk domain-containing protein n=1 Tax=Paenibacillus violae TaxID=3077234 RepID=A0ABU3RKN6_9BACL|nr:stalk domain-containing protein [Paenibacillus sp. PFR10]MDU0204836.1 stalk domain-containing protein [Paenibacillus sp. PFR10]